MSGVVGHGGFGCVDDDECAIANICISGEATWNPSNVSSCGCNLWYGWKGDDCLSYSGTTYFAMIYPMLQAIIMLENNIT